MTLVQRFMTGTYTITRKARGTYQDGLYVSGPDECFSVRGSMQPVSARELKLEEEGTRLKQYYNFFTDVPIMTINTKTLADSDRVTINGETYKVLSVMHWQGVRLPYYQATLAREPEQ